jgi:hypothetical protein
MNEETFNQELRQFLKKVGITTQREIERAVDEAVKSGRLTGNETLKARAVVHIEGLPDEITVSGEIRLS